MHVYRRSLCSHTLGSLPYVELEAGAHSWHLISELRVLHRRARMHLFVCIGAFRVCVFSENTLQLF